MSGTLSYAGRYINYYDEYDDSKTIVIRIDNVDGQKGYVLRIQTMDDLAYRLYGMVGDPDMVSSNPANVFMELREDYSPGGYQVHVKTKNEVRTNNFSYTKFDDEYDLLTFSVATVDAKGAYNALLTGRIKIRR